MRLARLALVALIGALAVPTARAADTDAFATPELIEAARKEGSLTLYTTLVIENEQGMLKHFNQRFPFVKVSMVRAPGGQLLTRVQAEAAAGKLTADVINLSDRGLVAKVADLFADYAPPNAADYPPESRTAGKLWPRATVAWCIAWNEALVKEPPKTWADLLKPQYKGQLGEVIILSGGSTLTRAMFQTQVLGDGYWAALARNTPTLYPSGAPMADAMVRGEIALGAILTNQILPKAFEGAPIKWVYPPEGVPMLPLADGIPKTAPSPNAARLFMNWSLSAEAQAIAVREQAIFSSLRGSPAPGAEGQSVKTWFPDAAEQDRMRETWIASWNATFGYRQ